MAFELRLPPLAVALEPDVEPVGREIPAESLRPFDDQLMGREEVVQAKFGELVSRAQTIEIDMGDRHPASRHRSARG